MFPIFEKLGGDEAAIKALREGREAVETRADWPTTHVRKKWRKHGLPGVVVKQLMRICDERGISYASSDFEHAKEPAQ